MRLFGFALLLCLLATPAARAITITGYSTAANDRWAANPTGPITGPFTPNTNAAFVGLNYDLSGVGWQSSNTSGWQDLSVTLISPMHFAGAKHVPFSYINTTYSFQNTDGNIVSRAIGGNLSLADVGGVSADGRVIRLDTPFGSSDKVKIYRMLDTGAYANLSGKSVILYGHGNSGGANYQRRLGLGVVSITSNNHIYTAQSASLTNYVTTLISGDSGSPSFVTYNGELHLLGTHYANASGYSQDNNFSFSGLYVGVNAFLAADGYALRWSIDTAYSRVWEGTTDGTFGTAANWLSLNQPSEFTSAAFDGAVTGNRNITLGSAASVRGMLIKSSVGANAFTFSGSTLTLFESGLRNEDADPLTINNPITLGGSQNWEAQNGPIALGGDIATGGFLVVLSGEQPITLTGNLTGTGSIAWDNPGTWTVPGGQLALTTGKLFVHRGVVNLTTGNTYSGGTVVTGGILLANNPAGSATGSGSVTLLNDALLGGNGVISGGVACQNTSGLTANLTTAPGSHDKLDITGALALGNTSTLTITANGSATNGTYTLATAAGGITGALPALILPANWSATAQISGNNLNLVVVSTTLSTPVITAGQRATTIVNTPLVHQILASQSPTSYALASGSLPPGVTLNTTTGVLSGSPTQAGTYLVSFTATNSVGTSSSAALVIQIAPASTAIVWERFSYPLGSTNPDPDGGANSNNGLPATNPGGSPPGTGTGLYGTYGVDQTVVTGLSYSDANGDLVSAANALRRNGGTSFSASVPNIYRNMTSDPFALHRSIASSNFFGWNGGSATQLFFSVLLNANAINTGTDNRFVIELGKDNVSWKLYPGQYNGTSQWRYGDSDGTQAPLGTATPNQTVLVVGRLSFNSATSTVADFWFNPTLGQTLGTPTYTKTITTTTSGVQFRGIQTRDGANVLSYDEFRLGPTQDSVMPFTASLPAAPSSLSATTVLATQLTLNWTDNSANETGFLIERSANGSSGWTQVGSVAANTTSFTDTGLAPNTAYFYRVLATNVAGGSSLSGSFNVTTDVGNGPGSIQFSAATYSVTENNMTSQANVSGVNTSGGVVTGVTLGSNGSGYVAAPRVFIYDNLNGSAAGATGTTTINGSGQITGVTITNGGSGYTGVPIARIVGNVAQITVNRVGGSTGAVSVCYAAWAPDTSSWARPYRSGPTLNFANEVNPIGSQAVAARGVLTWADGDSSPKTLYVPIECDSQFNTTTSVTTPLAIPEGTETLYIALANPTGGAGLGSQTRSVIEILDRDAPAAGVISFGRPRNFVREDVGTASIVVKRTGGSTGAVSVAYATSSSSLPATSTSNMPQFSAATAGTDYTTASGTLTWADGDSADKIISVPITNNPETESQEVFKIDLTSPTGGALLSRNTIEGVTLGNGITHTALVCIIDSTATSFDVQNYNTYKDSRIILPTNSGAVRGLLAYLPGTGGDSRPWISSYSTWQNVAKQLGFALYGQNGNGYGARYIADIGTHFDLLDSLADHTGHPELINAPNAVAGTSAGGFDASSSANYLAERFIGFVGVIGGNPYDGTSASPVLTKLPNIMLPGSSDATVPPSELHQDFQTWRAQGAQSAISVNWGYGHTDVGNSHEMAFGFLAEIIRLRYPSNQSPGTAFGQTPTLASLTESSGWLADQNANPLAVTTSQVAIAPYASYVGTKSAASWLPNETLARTYRAMTSRHSALQSGDPKQTPIAFTTPTALQTFPGGPGGSFTLTVAGQGGYSNFNRVDFYDGATLLGTDTTAPYSITVNNLSAGVHLLTATSSTDGSGEIRHTFRNIVVQNTITPAAPQIMPSQTATGTVGFGFSYGITTTGVATSFAHVGGTMPPGLNFNTTTGVLSGTPTTVGTYTPSFTATNADGTSSAVVVTFNVTAITPAFIYEPFNYTVGSNSPDPDGGINSGNGLPASNVGGNPSGTSTGFFGNYGTTLDVATGLTYAQGSKTLVTSGGAGAPNNAAFGTAVTVYRNMTTDPHLSLRVGGAVNGNFAADGQAIFVSFLARSSSTTSRAFWLGFTSGSRNIYVGNTASKWSIEDNAAGLLSTSTGAFTPSTTALIVVRLTFAAGAADTMSLWVNPPLGDALPATPDATLTIGADWTFSQMNFRPQVLGAMTMDEFRMGSSYASVTPFTLPPPPNAPSALSATPVSGTQINLTWTDNSTDETGFKLERSPDGSTGWTQIATPAVNATSYSDSGLIAGYSYYYRLRSTNPNGDSAFTSNASATTWTAAEAWRNTWFGTIANIGDAADSADPDGDAQTNVQERGANTDPLAPGAPAAAAAPALPARLVTLAPAADAHVEASNPNTNFSTSDLLVRSESAVREAFLRYDLAALAGTVERAQLVFWPTSADSQTPTFSIQQIVDAGDAWTETGLTWNNKPASLTANATSFAGPVAAGIPRVVDVTAMVTETLANDAAKQLGLRLFATGSMPSQASSFGSKENGGTFRYPYLHITLRASAAAPVKLMHVGDSITRGSAGGIGSNTFSNAGWRYYLHNLLLAAGLDFRAVGPRIDGSIAAFRLGSDGSSNSSLADRPLLFPANAGYSGQNIEYIRDNIAAWLATYSPDVITLMIGTNNMGYTGSPLVATQAEIDNWKSRYTTLLNNILAASPTVKVVMATIPPAGGIYQACNSTRIEPFNAQVIQVLFAQYAAANPGRFFLVDNYAALAPSDIGSDSVHPTSLGHQKLARSWHAGLMAAFGRADEVRFVNQLAGADAPLRGGALAGNALGNATAPLVPGWTSALLRAKSDPLADNRAKAILKFDLTDLPAFVGTARLCLAYHGASPTGDLAGGSTLLHLYGVHDGADGWTKSSVTWNSAPGHDTNGNGVLPAAVTYLASVAVPATARTGDLVSFESAALRDFLTQQVGGDNLGSFVVVASGPQAYEVVLHASNQPDYQPAFLSVVPASTGMESFRTAAGLAADGSQDLLMPAGDGVPNLQKYAFNMLGNGPGQKPVLGAPNFIVLPDGGSAGLPRIGVDGTGRLQITFLRRKGSSNPGVSYAAEFSGTPASGWGVNPAATESVTSLDASFERVTVTDSVIRPSSRFARVKVTAP